MNQLFKEKKTLENDFKELDKRLIGSNYGVHFEIKYFEFDRVPNYLDESCLKILFYEEEKEEKLTIEGNVNSILFDQAKKNIDKHLRFTSTNTQIKEKYEDWYFVTEQEFEIRKKMFWNVIENYINIPPQNCYEYIPEVGSYFYDCFVFWHLNYVFLNEKEGIFIHLCASD